MMHVEFDYDIMHHCRFRVTNRVLLEPVLPENSIADYYAKFEQGYCQSTNIVTPLLNGTSDVEDIIHPSYYHHGISPIRDISW